MQVVSNGSAGAYYLPRKNFIMGRPLFHGGWYPDHVIRLIKKDNLIEWVGDLHEYPKVKGELAYLHHDLLHLTHRGLDWMLQKTRNYTRISAQILYAHHHPQVRVKNFFGAMAREFYYRAIRQAGWKDGLLGWLEIIYQTFNAFLIQVQLWELQQQQTLDKQYQLLDKKISHEL
jgi:hypothetical protein